MPLILAVDDEHSGLYFRQLILEHAGYTVLSATGIDEALRLFRSNPVDLVVTDHLLGRRVGTEMVREMKRSKPSVPVIVLSGTSSIPQPLVEVNAFLSKSEGPEQLLELVKQLLGERSESANPQPNAQLTAPPLKELLATAQLQAKVGDHRYGRF